MGGLMDNEQLDRDHEEHRDWLEGRGADQLDREEWIRMSERGWSIATIYDHGPITAGPFIAITTWKKGLVLELSLNDAALFANSILSEVEIAQHDAMQPTTCDVCGSTDVADCISGEMYLCAEHLAAWEGSPISHDDMDRFLSEQRTRRQP